MACSRRSEKRLASLPRSAATVDAPVFSVGVWQRAQPIVTNWLRPRPIDAAPPGGSVDGVGGARNRWKNANFSIALSPPGVLVAWVSVTSLGVVANWQLGLRSRSDWNNSFVMPISTL